MPRDTRGMNTTTQIKDPDEDAGTSTPTGWRAPIVLRSLVLTGLLAVLTISLWTLIPFQGNADHGVGHWSLALPVLVLGGLILLSWPPLAPGLTARVVRWALIVGLGIFGFGQVVEGLGAFAYQEDGLSRANDLVELHAFGVGMTATGFTPLLAGFIMTGGIVLADRRGAAGSKVLLWSVVAAMAAVVAFEVGALIFGY